MMYVERMTVGTHQGHGSTQASALLLQAKKMLPPNGLKSGPQGQHIQ
jgi:hypothetical protein